MRCRICNSALEQVVDLGNQCLGGVFPGPGEPDPPRYPLVLCVCSQCQLLQLRDTVPAGLMFGSGYGYRSGVTETMRRHLEGIATEAVRMLGRQPRRVLDIGCNDGYLLAKLPDAEKVGIDPSDVEGPFLPYIKIKGFFPENMTWHGNRFDLIFSIACFYDSPDPVGFAKAVRANLADDGIWCCEVQDANAMLDGAWDGICHEHLCYYTAITFDLVCANAGLRPFKVEHNSCNGGSTRYWVKKEDTTFQFKHKMDYSPLAKWVELARLNIRSALYEASPNGLVHLLGASTKANTWLQYCFKDDIPWMKAASDRDPRKHGRRTPGTNIPIVSEEESRAMKPDVYVVGPWHFREEVVQREHEFLARGGKMIFPLPKVDVVEWKKIENRERH